MTCPNCGHQETTINEIDDSICCSNCGNVLESHQLVTVGRHAIEVRHNEPVTKDTEKGGGGEEGGGWFSRIASYFGVGQELSEQVEFKMAEVHKLLPKGYPKEVAVGAVIRFASSLHPTWTYDDYIAAFPLSLYKPAVIKSYLIFGGDNYSWERSTENQFDYTVEFIYPVIVDQLFISKPPPQFNLNTLKKNTRKLLHLGGEYGLNCGLKIRPLLIAVTCLCALHLRTKIPAKYISGRSSTTKRNSTKLYHNKTNFYFIWNFKAFSLVSFCSDRVLKKYYAIYYQFVTLCVKKFNWLPQPIESKQVFFHLEDVLKLYSKPEEEEEEEEEGEAMMKLPKELFYPVSFVEAILKTKLTMDYLNQAKEHLQRGSDTELLDKESITYCLYRLLKEGHSERELSILTVYQIRNLTCILDYKLTFEDISDKNNDLDRKLIAEDDMCDDEINLYL